MEMATNDEEVSRAAAVERLGEAIIRSIKSSGADLPSLDDDISTSNGNGSGTVQWTQYAPTASRSDAVVAELSRYVSSVQERFGPAFDLSIACDTNGRPLLYAACLGLCLSDRKLSVSSDDNDDVASTPLQIFFAILEYLINELGCPHDQPTFALGRCHRPPIHLLARSCHVSAVSALLQCGADPKDTDDEGWTALMATCMADGDDGDESGPTMDERLETARFLLDFQPPKYVDSDDESEENENNGFVVLNKDQDDDHDTGINNNNYRGYTALHLACEGLMAPMVQLLLERGADPRQRTWIGESPLGIVSWKEEEDNCAAAELCRKYLLTALDGSNDVDDSYREFMEEEQKVVALIKLVDNVLIPLANNESRDTTRRDRLLFTTVMKTIGMDPDEILGQKIATNWYEELHKRVSKLLPKAYTKIYRTGNAEPSEEEFDLITSHDGHAKDEAEFFIPADEEKPEAGGARRIDINVLRREAFAPYRERGLCPRNMDNILRLLVNPIKHTVAFAIPSDAILDRLATRTPKIVEVGAGTGYWSAVLRLRGVDIVAYDSSPPTASSTATSDDAENVFFSNECAYMDVIKGGGSDIFKSDEGKDLAADRALLMVWPNNADHIDNPHLYVETSTPPPPVWDADCLLAYLEAGGETVIYVGEREEEIELDDEASGPDCGFCSSRRFQKMLKDEFVLEEQMACPCWWLKDDDVTIWRRK